MRPANERWCYSVTPSLIGWACTQNDPCPFTARDGAAGVGASMVQLTSCPVNSLRPRQNGRHFPDDISLMKTFEFQMISLKYVTWCVIDNILTFVQIMAWRWTGDKPLSEPVMAKFSDADMLHLEVSSLNTCYGLSNLSSWLFLKSLSGECHRTPLMISQVWFR